MYNIGEKIKSIGINLSVVNAIFCIIAGVALVVQGVAMGGVGFILVGILIIIVGVIFSFIIYHIFYGFGEIIDLLRRINENTNRLYDLIEDYWYEDDEDEDDDNIIQKESFSQNIIKTEDGIEIIKPKTIIKSSDS